MCYGQKLKSFDYDTHREAELSAGDRTARASYSHSRESVRRGH